MKRIGKVQIFSLLFAGSLVFAPVTSALAAESGDEKNVVETSATEAEIYKDMLPLEEYSLSNGGTSLQEKLDSGVLPYSSLIMPRSGALSSIIHKSNPMTLDGRIIGYQKIEYRTIIQGGRPQFAFDTVKLGPPPAYTGMWALKSSDWTYGPTTITVHADYALGFFSSRAYCYHSV